jgi:hypothetical protein
LVTGDSLNPNNVPKGCSNFKIPNCKNYKLQARSGSEKDDFLCNECLDGFTAFFEAEGTLKLDATRDPPL